MRPKRTTVWERKPGYVRPPDSPAAERVRARLRPSALTRITDRFFDWWESTDSRVTVYASPEGSWLAKSSIWIGALALLSVVFIVDGRRDHVIQYFGTIVTLGLGSRAWFAWHQRHPVSPPHLITTREELLALAQGVLAAAAMFLGQWATASSLKNPTFEFFETLVQSILVGGGVFRIRTEASEKEDGRGSQRGGALLLILLLFAVFALAA